MTKGEWDAHSPRLFLSHLLYNSTKRPAAVAVVLSASAKTETEASTITNQSAIGIHRAILPLNDL